MNILQVKKYCFQGKFSYSPLGKAIEKQTESEVGALKSLGTTKKKDNIKQNEAVFPKSILNDLIINKLKQIIKLQDIIKTGYLYYKSKSRKIYHFTEYSLPIFLRDMHEGYLSLKDADDVQSKFANKLKSIGKGIKSIEKKSYF